MSKIRALMKPEIKPTFLNDLINTLSVTEKKAFVKHVNSLSKSNQKKYMVNFPQNQSPQPKAIKGKHTKEHANRIASADKYLTKLILQFLKSFENGNSKQNSIKQLMQQATILADRELYRHALRTSDKVIALALKHELWTNVIDACDLEIKILQSTSFKGSQIKNKLTAILKQKGIALKSIQQQIEVESHAYKLMVAYNDPHSKSSHNMHTRLNLTQSDYKPLEIGAKLEHLFFESLTCKSNFDLVNLQKSSFTFTSLLADNIFLIDRYGHKLSWSLVHHTYCSKMINSYADHFILQKLKNELRKMTIAFNKKMFINIESMLFLAEAIDSLDINMENKCSEAPEPENHPTNFENTEDLIKLFAKEVEIEYLFIQNQFDETYLKTSGFNNKVCLFPGLHSMNTKECIKLTCLYELNQFRLLEYKLSNLKRHLNKTQFSEPYILIFIELISNLIKSVNVKKRKDLFKDTFKKLKSRHVHKLPLIYLLPLSLQYWIKMKTQE